MISIAWSRESSGTVTSTTFRPTASMADHP